MNEQELAAFTTITKIDSAISSRNSQIMSIEASEQERIEKGASIQHPQYGHLAGLIAEVEQLQAKRRDIEFMEAYRQKLLNEKIVFQLEDQATIQPIIQPTTQPTIQEQPKSDNTVLALAVATLALIGGD